MAAAECAGARSFPKFKRDVGGGGSSVTTCAGISSSSSSSRRRGVVIIGGGSGGGSSNVTVVIIGGSSSNVVGVCISGGGGSDVAGIIIGGGCNPYRRLRIGRFESGTGQHDGTNSINSCYNSGKARTTKQCYSSNSPTVGRQLLIQNNAFLDEASISRHARNNTHTHAQQRKQQMPIDIKISLKISIKEQDGLMAIQGSTSKRKKTEKVVVRKLPVIPHRDR